MAMSTEERTQLLYFAYGSNMDAAQMRRRCPGAQLVGKASLRDHHLVFPLPDETWGGGVASIAPRPNARVEGVLYRLTAEDFDALDDFEDVDRGDYARRLVSVQDANGATSGAWTYVSPREPGRFVPPSPAYLDAMVRGAVAQGLSSSYVAELRAIPTTRVEKGG
jgi:gamma-glutamylcyclotransferase (GGCT)/AIG2-like uncharacterized protein YtfP